MWDMFGPTTYRKFQMSGAFKFFMSMSMCTSDTYFLNYGESDDRVTKLATSDRQAAVRTLALGMRLT